LRSISTGNTEILIGRKTLASPTETEQKAVFRFESENAVFEDGSWIGPTPRIAVYDSTFINDNVFSGDFVSADHLKKQYGLVLGEEGVARIKRISKLDEENRENNKAIKHAENHLNSVINSINLLGKMTHHDFLTLEKRSDVDDAITEKNTQVERVRRAKEIKAAPEPNLFILPSEAKRFADLLLSSIEGIAEQALSAVRSHLAAHKCADKESETTHILPPLKVRPPLRHNPILKGGSLMGEHAADPIERWTAKRRAALVLNVLKGETSVAEAARQHGLKVADVAKWQDQYLRAAENGLRRRPKDEEALKDEHIKKLQQKIGELVVENDVLREALKPYPLAREMSDA
jgi:transposase-like protein